MKRSLLTFLMLFVLNLAMVAQIVSTILGPGQYINDGITFDESGNLYGSDHSGYGVYRYTVEGELETLATFDNHPNGIVLDQEQNLYVAVPQGNKIYKIDPQGYVSQYCPYIPNPNGLIFENDSDTLIVTSYAYNTLSKLAPDGDLSLWIVSDELNGPLGLCYDDQNTLYVSNFNDGKVFKVVDDNLEYFATVPGAYLGTSYFSTGYILWSDGYIYATGFAKNIVYRINGNGEVEEYAGSGVFGVLDGEASEAQFKNPNGIAKKSTSNEIYVSGYESHAVRIISDETSGLHSQVNHNEHTVRCFPNPCKDKVHLDCDMPLRSFKLHDASGELMLSGVFCESEKIHSIDLSSCPEGFYTISLKGEDGVINCHIIKQ